jgi:hypothetical protein
MSTHLFLPLSLGLAILGGAAGPATTGDTWEGFTSVLADFFMGPQVQEEFRWQGAVAAGGTVEIKGVNGAIHAEPATGRDVEVVALKRGRRSSPREVEVRVVPHGGGLTICAVYPSTGRANECVPGAGGPMSVRNNDVSVEFTVRLPAGLGLVARTVNGGVQASGLDGRVEAHTVNGSVRVATLGTAAVETVNGSIDASMARADWRDEASFQTVNGSITVALPREASTAVEARTVNGGITVDFEMAATRASRRELSGTIGAGGRRLALNTVNGAIHLRRAP